MNIDRKKIRSVESADSTSPWYGLSVSDGAVVVETDGDGGTDVDLTNESVAVETSSDSAVAVTSDGELINYPPGEQHDLRAHLGWYTADDDTLTLLEFVEADHS